MHAMHEQMKAERTRRAVVTSAEGERQAAITRAEGDRQAVVLRSEGDKQQRILRAEGEAEAIQRVAEAEKFRQETVAEGEAGAILSVYGAIHEGAPDTPLLTIKYLEALRAMADGRATKIVVPTELAGIAGSLTAVADLLGGNNSNGTGGDGAEPPRVPDAGASAATRAVPAGVIGSADPAAVRLSPFPQKSKRRRLEEVAVPEQSAVDAVNQYFTEAARVIDLDDDLYGILTTSYREVAVQVPVRLDDGELMVARGYRVQHNGARGPYKGGVRFHPNAASTRSAPWRRS